MLGECDWGIRDLSRIEIDAAGIPRFNMPRSNRTTRSDHMLRRWVWPFHHP